MRLVLALAASAVVLSACGSGDGGAAHKSAERADPNIALIQKRYGDCLLKLHAKLDQGGPRYYAYDVSGGRYLVFTAGKFRGKTLTAPKDDNASAILASVGC